MLLTICPHCKAQFKVTPDQLNIRQGRVMCGRCRHVFNAFQSLERVDSAFLPKPEPAFRAPAHQGLPADETTRDASLPPAFESVAPQAIVESLPEEQGPVVDSRDEEIPAPVRAAEKARPQQQVAPATSAPYAETVASVSDEIDLIQPGGGHRAWRLGVLLLAIVLAGQAAYFFRSPIVSTYPEVRPYFSVACEWLSCTLPWNRDDIALKVETSDLIEEIGKPGRFLLTAVISNRAKTVQDYPHIELTLSDTNNQTLTRRVLQPRDYLGRPVRRDEGMAPGSESSLNLSLEASNSRAAGYHLLLFYP
jgi:predicted Zn finger-like uncharacterized protein